MPATPNALKMKGLSVFLYHIEAFFEDHFPFAWSTPFPTFLRLAIVSQQPEVIQTCNLRKSIANMARISHIESFLQETSSLVQASCLHLRSFRAHFARYVVLYFDVSDKPRHIKMIWTEFQWIGVVKFRVKTRCVPIHLHFPINFPDLPELSCPPSHLDSPIILETTESSSGDAAVEENSITSTAYSFSWLTERR